MKMKGFPTISLAFALTLFFVSNITWASHAEDDVGLSDAFTAALKGINADVFFSSNVRDSGAFKNFGKMKDGGRLDPEKSYQSNLFNARYQIDAQHYQEIADKVCSPLLEAYAEDLDDAEGDVDPYAFTSQVTKKFENAGAYVLPIQIEKKSFQAEYYNPDWKKARNPNVLGGNEEISNAYDLGKYKGDKPGRVTFQDSGLVVVKSERDRKNSDFFPLNSGISDFHLWITKNHGVEVKKFDLQYNLIQPYLFVFHQNPADINSEQIFLYVDVPYSVHSDGFRVNPTLNLSKQSEGVKCYAMSSALAKWRGGFEEYRRGERSNSLLVALAPVTYPLSASIKKKGRTSVFSVTKEVISAPSLECFLSLQGLGLNDGEECSSQGYGEQFFKLINEEVCVKIDGNIKTPPVNDIYYYRPWGTKPPYVHKTFEVRDAACQPLNK
jgi:hypothetical protein